MVSTRSTPNSGWSSSLRPLLELRPPLELQPALLPGDAADDRTVAELLNAALKGDLSRAKELAKELRKAGKGVDEAVAGAAVGVTGNKRRGPLHLAAANGKVLMCKFLIKTCKVDVDATDAGEVGLIGHGYEVFAISDDLFRCVGTNFSNTRTGIHSKYKAASELWS